MKSFFSDPHTDGLSIFSIFASQWFVRLIYMTILCVSFGGLFPIMYWFGLIECFLCAIVDRHNLINAFAVCAKYDTSIATSIIQIMPMALLGNGVLAGSMMCESHT